MAGWVPIITPLGSPARFPATRWPARARFEPAGKTETTGQSARARGCGEKCAGVRFSADEKAKRNEIERILITRKQRQLTGYPKRPRRSRQDLAQTRKNVFFQVNQPCRFPGRPASPAGPWQRWRTGCWPLGLATGHPFRAGQSRGLFPPACKQRCRRNAGPAHAGGGTSVVAGALETKRFGVGGLPPAPQAAVFKLAPDRKIVNLSRTPRCECSPQ